MDDNPTNCRILATQAAKWGMVPRDTQNAAQALEWLRAGERFDLAVLDMQMPGMDGLTLAAEIRKLPGWQQPCPWCSWLPWACTLDQPEAGQRRVCQLA